MVFKEKSGRKCPWRWLWVWVAVCGVWCGEAWGAVAGEPLRRVDTLAVEGVKVSGTVWGDDTGDRLPGAYVYLGEERLLVGSTDTAGIFRLEGVPKGEVVLSVSYVGYEMFSGLFRVDRDLDLGDIRLRSMTLDEVVVREKPPLMIARGDTVKFNAAAVKVAPDADLEALIKKFPGLEVVDGKIMANGKEVVKIYIDGQEYALGNPGEVLRNLPAKLVERIAMYDERSRMAEFGGYDDGSRYRVLNLETHDPERTKVFGEAEAGYGMTLPPERTFDENNYMLSGRGNVFTPKHKWTLSADWRNSGSSGELPGARLEPERGRMRNGSAFANVSSKLGEEKNLTGSYNFSNNDGYSASLSRVEYFPTERYEMRVYDSERHSWDKGSDHRAAVELNLGRGWKDLLMVSVSVNRSETEGRGVSLTENVEDGDTVNVSSMASRNRNHSTDVSGNVMWMKNIGESKRTFAWEMRGNYSRRVAESWTNSEEHAVDEAGVRSDTVRNLLNSNDNDGYSFDIGGKWSEHLSEKWSMDVDYSYRQDVDRTGQRSRVFRDAGFVEETGVDTAQTNDLRNAYRVHAYGLSLSFNPGEWSLNGGVELSHTRMRNRYRYLGRGDSVLVSRYVDVSPSLVFNCSLGEGGNLGISYRGQSSSPNAAQLQDVLTVNSPLSVSRGNPGLQKSYSHSLNASIFGFRPETFNSYHAMMSASQTFNAMATDTWVMERDTVVEGYALSRGAQLSMPVNLDGEWRFSVNGNYSFRWEKAKLRFSTGGGYSFSRTPSVYDHVLNRSSSHTANLHVQVSTDVSEYWDVSLSSSSGGTFARNTETEKTRSFNENLSADARWECAEGALRGIFVQASYNGQFYLTWRGRERTSQPEHVLGASVGKKFGRENRWRVSLSCDDILQNRRTMNYSLGDLSSTTNYSMLPSATIMLGITYRFDNIRPGKEE